MGSKSSSASVNTDVTQNLADNRVIDGGGAGNTNVGGNITISQTGNGRGEYNITTTDFGALDTASEAIDRSFASAENSISAVQTIAGDAGATISAALNKVTDFATTQTAPEGGQTTQYIVLALAVVGIAFAMRKGSK
jgi:hypothetical protein